jgi:hypothetical protein
VALDVAQVAVLKELIASEKDANWRESLKGRLRKLK